MPNLFTYGSLMCSDILCHVAGCRVDFVPASLKDFQRSRINGQEYPGIVAHPGGEVEGVLYLELPQAAMERLDNFEGEQYTRQEVTVITRQFIQLKAMVYVIKPEYSFLLTGVAWSYEHFLAVGKTTFLQAYVGFEKI